MEHIGCDPNCTMLPTPFSQDAILPQCIVGVNKSPKHNVGNRMWTETQPHLYFPLLLFIPFFFAAPRSWHTHSPLDLSEK
ncbi:uncharacterized [Tachysurus ichikawai]